MSIPTKKSQSMSYSIDLPFNVINSQVFAMQIEKEYHGKKILGGILNLTAISRDIGLIRIGQIGKYFLKWKNHVVIDDHHLDYLEKISDNAEYKLKKSAKGSVLSLETFEVVNIMLGVNAVIPMIDGSDLVLTPAFGHAIRIKKIVELISKSDELAGLNLIDIYATSHGIAGGLKKPEIQYLVRDNAKTMQWTSRNQASLGGRKITICNVANIRILNFAPQLEASEGVRILSAFASIGNKSRSISRDEIRLIQRIPILSRSNQRAQRWKNAHELSELNSSCFFQITPEDHDPYQLAEQLDREGPLVIAAPGSAAYIPLCLCKRTKLVLMPLAGQPKYNIDGYVYDFACYGRSVHFVAAKRNHKWNWNDEFTINSKILLNAIREICTSL